MNRLITRLQRRSRVAVGSTMALIVSLPLGATIGLAATATAAPSPERPAATDSQAKKAPKGSEKAAKGETASTLGDAVPWTADPKASAAAAAADESFDALVFSKTAASGTPTSTRRSPPSRSSAPTNNFTVTPPRTAARSPTPTSRSTRSSSSCPPPVTSSTPTSRPRSSATSRRGGGYAGIHAASDTEYDWPWYGKLVGAYFNNHPAGTPTATVKVEDPAHPSTAGLPAPLAAHRRVVQLPDQPAATHQVHVLAVAGRDDLHPRHRAMGADHPIAWCQDYDGGRSLVHRHGPHRGVVHRRQRSSTTSSAASRPLPVSSTPTARRR